MGSMASKKAGALPFAIIRAQTVPSVAQECSPIFRDTTDFSSFPLEKSIQHGLQSSEFLIVICSPRAVNSPWGCKEVQTFINLGREDYIIPFIIEGEAQSVNSSKECFPQVLKNLSGSRELLGVNVNENGRDSAAIKVITSIFRLNFDTLW